MACCVELASLFLLDRSVSDSSHHGAGLLACASSLCGWVMRAARREPRPPQTERHGGRSLQTPRREDAPDEKTVLGRRPWLPRTRRRTEFRWDEITGWRR